MDRTVLITGATGTVGRVVAETFAQTGARLAVTGRRESALQALAGVLSLPDERLLVMPADLADSKNVLALVSAIDARWGGVDVLLNVAGGWRGGSRVADLKEPEWDAILDMNLRSAFLINRAVLPHMVEQRWGRIVNFGSRAVVSPGAKQVAYNVAKSGVVALTQSISSDYRRRGVAANVVLPAIIDTPQNREGSPDADHTRWVPPGDLAELLLFLASDAGGSLNGASIPVFAQL